MIDNLQSRIGKKQPFASTHEEAYLNVLLTTSLLESGVVRVLKSRGFTQASYNVLRILAGDDHALSCAQVRDRMVARVPDVTRLIDRLMDRGYVTRERADSDRRVVRVSITTAGRDAISGLDTELIRLHESQLSSLTPNDLTTLIEILSRARTGLEAPPPAGSSNSTTSPHTQGTHHV